MFGGWYVVATRDNVAALIFGPTKTRQEVETLLGGAPKTAEGMFNIARGGPVRYGVAFFLFDQLQVGRCNAKAWLTITKESWELDALAPNVIDQLIRDEIEKLIDFERWTPNVSREHANEQLYERVGVNFETIKHRMDWT